MLASAVMAGLVPAIHAAPPQSCVQHRAAMSSRRLVAIRGTEIVDGRDKPGHDALKAQPLLRGSKLTVTN